MLKNISKLAIANAFGQLLQILTLPLLALLFQPESFGLFAQVTAITTIASVVVNLQIHNSIIQSIDKSELRIHLEAGTAAALCFASPVAIAVVALTCGNIITSENAAIAILATILTSITCINNVLKGFLTANSDFNSLTHFITIRSIALVTSQIAAGLLDASAIGLITGATLAEVLAAVYLKNKIGNPNQKPTIVESIKSIKLLANRHPDTIKIGTIQELVSTSTFMLPVYLVGLAYSSQEAGQFAMAQRIIWAPFLLLAQSITPVIYKHAASRTKELLPAWKKKSLLLVVALSILTAALSFIILDNLTIRILGENWHLAASITPWIGIWALSFLASLYFRVCYRVLRQQRIQLVQDLVIVCAILLASLQIESNFLLLAKTLAAIGTIQNASYILGALYIVGKKSTEAK